MVLAASRVASVGPDVHVVLDDEKGKMMRSHKDGVVKAFKEEGATKLQPGDLAPLIAVNDIAPDGSVRPGK